MISSKSRICCSRQDLSFARHSYFRSRAQSKSSRILPHREFPASGRLPRCQTSSLSAWRSVSEWSDCALDSGPTSQWFCWRPHQPDSACRCRLRRERCLSIHAIVDLKLPWTLHLLQAVALRYLSVIIYWRLFVLLALNSDWCTFWFLILIIN